MFNLAGFKATISASVPYKLIDDLFFVFISTSLIVLFLIGYKIVESKKTNQTQIIKWAIIFSLLMTFSIPSHSSDLYGYIARGAQQTLHHQNPYLETVSKIDDYSKNQLFFNFMWPRQPTTYGPVFIYITKAVVFLSNNNFLYSFINFKLFNLTLFFLLVLFTLRLNKTKELFLIAWNPLILTQGLWNCHNDLLSGVLIFLGLYLLLKENYFFSIFCLTFAAGVKFVSILIIPIVFFYFLKTKPERTIFLHFVLGLCAGMILIGIFSIDYLVPNKPADLKNIGLIVNSFNFVHKSLIAAIFTLIKYFCKWQNINCNLNSIQLFLKYSFYSLFALFYFLTLIRKKSNLTFDISLVLFIFFAFVIAKFHSWYLLNLIVLIPLLENKGKETLPLQKLLIALSMSHVYALTFLDQAKILNFVSMTLLPIVFVLMKEKKK